MLYVYDTPQKGVEEAIAFTMTNTCMGLVASLLMTAARQTALIWHFPVMHFTVQLISVIRCALGSHMVTPHLFHWKAYWTNAAQKFLKKILYTKYKKCSWEISKFHRCLSHLFCDVSIIKHTVAAMLLVCILMSELLCIVESWLVLGTRHIEECVAVYTADSFGTERCLFSIWLFI